MGGFDELREKRGTEGINISMAMKSTDNNTERIRTKKHKEVKGFQIIFKR